MYKEEVSVAEAKARFSDLINRVIYGHEEIVITRRGKPVAVITAPSGKGLASVHGWLKEEDSFPREMQKLESSRHMRRLRTAKRTGP